MTSLQDLAFKYLNMRELNDEIKNKDPASKGY